MEDPWPIKGTITPTEHGYSASLDEPHEHLTMAEHNWLQRAVDRAAREYGDGTEVQVRFDGKKFHGPSDFELLGPIDEES